MGIDPRVVWTTIGTKLYRVAPEHVRPLSAVEEMRQHKEVPTSWAHQLANVIPPNGGTQYQNLIGQPNNPGTPASPSQIAPGSNEIPAEGQSGTVAPPASINDQPDGEPEVSSKAPTVSAELPEMAPHEVHVPSDDDELYAELFTEAIPTYHVNAQQCWALEVEISQQDIVNWTTETNPHEMAFVATAAKRQRSEVKLRDLTPEEQQRFHEAKLKEIDSWISTEGHATPNPKGKHTQAPMGPHMEKGRRRHHSQ